MEYIHGKLAKDPCFPYNPSWGKQYGKVLVSYLSIRGRILDQLEQSRCASVKSNEFLVLLDFVIQRR